MSNAEHDVAESSLTSRLRLAVVRLNRRLRAQRTSSSITLTQLSALFCLYKCGPLTPGELAAKEVVQPPSMTRVIAALEELGYVSRRPHPSDGRQAIVEITEEGSAHIQADISAREAWLGQGTAASDSISGIPGSPALNVIASRATAGVNARIMVGDSVAGVLEHVRKAVRDDGITVEVVEANEPSPVSPYDGDEAFALLESTIAADRERALGGLLPWMWLSGAVSDSTRAFIKEARLIRSTKVPPTIWVARLTLAKGIEFVASLPVLAIFAIGAGATLGWDLVAVGWEVVLFPLGILLQAALVLAIGLIVAPLTVFFRDLERAVKLVLRFAFYATPIVYDLGDLPANLQTLGALNPLAGVLSIYRSAFFPEALDWTAVGVSAGMTALVLLVGALVFRRSIHAVLKEV